MITYKCSRCQVELVTDDSLASQTEPCPACGHVNQVPKSKEQLKQEKLAKKEAEKQAEATALERKQRQAVAAREAERANAEAARAAEKVMAEAEAREYQSAVALAKSDPYTLKNWYCNVEGKQWGPMTQSSVQAWINQGKVGGVNYVRFEGGDSWVRVGDLPEIFVLLAEVPHHPESPHHPTADNGPRCPSCGSRHISANKEGMRAGNACCGALLLGPLGLLCGLSSKVVVTCLSCGHQWKRGR